MVRVSLRRQAFDFGDSNHRQEAHEEKEAGEKEAEGTDVRADINPGRPVIPPIRRQKVPMQANHDNNKSFEPHADIDQDREDKHHDEILAQFLEPE